jgi:hypothetical protein
VSPFLTTTRVGVLGLGFVVATLGFVVGLVAVTFGLVDVLVFGEVEGLGVD